MFSSSRWPPSLGVGVPHGSAFLFRAPQMRLPFTTFPAVYLGSVVVLVLTGIGWSAVKSACQGPPAAPGACLAALAHPDVLR
jgi:hypothetical protein